MRVLCGENWVYAHGMDVCLACEGTFGERHGGWRERMVIYTATYSYGGTSHHCPARSQIWAQISDFHLRSALHPT